MIDSDVFLFGLAMLAVIGACTGRLLNLCSDRFPEHDRLRDQLAALRKPWSICSGCRSPLSFSERLPILGWIVNRGRCRSCQRRISIRYPVLEFVTATLFVLLYLSEIRFDPEHGFRNGLLSAEGPPGPEVVPSLWSAAIWLHVRYALHLLMICGLIVATDIDRRLRIIPDGCTVPIAVVAIPLSLLFGQLYVVPIWFQDPSIVRTLQEWTRNSLDPWQYHLLKPLLTPWDPTPFLQTWPHLHGFLVSCLGLLAGAGAIWMVRQIGFLALRQEAMGFGDVILMGMVGSVLGWQPTLAICAIGAPMLAVVFALFNWIVHRDHEIPYGPFLSAATILLLLTWPVTWPFAKRFLDMGPLLLPMAALGAFFLATSLYGIHLVKKALGWQLQDAPVEHWSSADHLQYYNSERPDEQTGQWPQQQWPGNRSGRGLSHLHHWRHGR